MVLSILRHYNYIPNDYIKLFKNKSHMLLLPDPVPPHQLFKEVKGCQRETMSCRLHSR